MKKWNELLRDKVNETPFIRAKYENNDSKDQWSCIVSAMDWLDVGMTNIDSALKELNSSKKLETCLKFYQYICCIDMIWGSICQLHRVFVNKDTKPLNNDSTVFQKKFFDVDDNDYFEEIRACFGAHPAELKTKKTTGTAQIRKFASWSTAFGTPQTLSVHVYSNIPDATPEKISVTVDELQGFLELRYQYIQTLLDVIDREIESHVQSMKKLVIHKSDSIEEQIEILKCESNKRFGNGFLIDTLEQIEHFLATEFHCTKNQDAIDSFTQRIRSGIVEVYECLQNMTEDSLEIESILMPEYIPRGNSFGYDFSKLQSSVFDKMCRVYITDTITEPLADYICFEYETEAELYWLTVISLNLAQDDLVSEDSCAEAVPIASLWDELLDEQQILSARQCYLFGNKVVYIDMDDQSDLLVYDLTNNSWRTRSNESFWDSWNSAPHLFVPIKNEEAVSMIFEHG